MKFRHSALAHRYLDGLCGIEIGGSAHNPFGLCRKNVDVVADMDTVFKRSEIEQCGEALAVDIVAPGDALPMPDASQDFVISSHVIEHFFDPIKTIEEWLRVVRPGGFVVMIVPHRDRTFDRDRPRTTLDELLKRHDGTVKDDVPPPNAHHTVWIADDVVELCRHCGFDLVEVQDPDDKVGNGFTVVIRKPGDLGGPPRPLGGLTRLRYRVRAWLAP